MNDDAQRLQRLAIGRHICAAITAMFAYLKRSLSEATANL